MSTRFLIMLAMAAVLGGCAAVRGGAGQSAEPPVSQQTATSEARQRAKVHAELGALYMQRGNMGVALEEARTALQADSGYAPAHNLMGLVYMQLHEDLSAEKSFELALSLAPADPEINNSYGWFLCQSGREQKAMPYFQVAIKSPLYATPSMPATNAGICALRLKDDKSAEEHFSRALRLDSNNDRALYFLSDISYRQGRYAAARQYLADLHKLTEPGPESLWLAVRVEHKMGDREAEARFATQLKRRFNGTPEQQKLMQGQFE